jgi:hypothetical protein
MGSINPQTTSAKNHYGKSNYPNAEQAITIKKEVVRDPEIKKQQYEKIVYHMYCHRYINRSCSIIDKSQEASYQEKRRQGQGLLMEEGKDKSRKNKMPGNLIFAYCAENNPGKAPLRIWQV